MENSNIPNRIGRKENNPLPSKEDNWIIRKILKKKDFLSKLLPQKTVIKTNARNNTAQQVYTKTNNLIREGLAKPTASTGKPMEEIHGGAKFMAQMSNIGGGSKATGGGGVQSGFNIITNNQKAKTVLELQEKSQKLIGKSQK